MKYRFPAYALKNKNSRLLEGDALIKQNSYLHINGRKQFFSVRAAREGLPLLLYLHGGPGDAALPLVRKYNQALENTFTVAVWEQRGAGKSYYPFAEQELLTIQTFVDDLHAVVSCLLEHFHQEKLFLVGHSWGSVLGIRFIREYPQLVHTYIGCGQVVDMQESANRQFQFVLAKCKELRNQKALERLSQIDVSYTSQSWLSELLFVTRLVVKYQGSLYGKSSYNSFVRDFLLSPEYSIKDLLNREKGSLQSILRLWPELMTVRFCEFTSFALPVVFLEGRYDYHVSSLLAEEYFQTITTQKQFYWFEKSCHFPQWSESDKFHEILCSLI